MRKATLKVILEDHFYETFAAAIEITPIYIEAFESVDVCDDPFMAGIKPNGVTRSGMMKVMKRRENVAEELASHITELLIQEMKAHDLKNGYKPSEGNADE